MTRKLTATILTLCMLLTLFSACTGAPGTTDPQTGTVGTTGGEDPGPQPVRLSVMTILQTGVEYDKEMLTFKTIEEETGVSFDFSLIPLADYAQKFQTTLMSNSIPDMIAGHTMDMTEYIYAGKFLRLDELLEEHGTNILKAYSDRGLSNNLKFADGGMYAIWSLRERAFNINNTINNRLLKETNQPMPTSMSELYTTLQKFKEARGDGFIPFGCGAWAQTGNSISNMVKKSYGVISDFFLYDDGYSFAPYQKQDRYKAALSWLAKAYDEGLVDPLLFGTNDDEIVKQLTSDQIGFFSSWGDGFGLWGDGGSYGVDYVPAPVMDTEFGQGYEVQPSKQGGAYYISSACSNPEAAIRAIDYIYSEEGTKLMNWGVEGVTYTQAADGTRAYTPLVTENEQGAVAGRYSQGLVPPGFPCIQLKDAEYVLNNPLTAQYEELLQGKTFPPEQPALTPTIEEQSEFTGIMTDVYEFVAQQETAFITGQLDIEKDFDSFISQLEGMNIQRAIDIKTAQYERYLAK